MRYSWRWDWVYLANNCVTNNNFIGSEGNVIKPQSFDHSILQRGNATVQFWSYFSFSLFLKLASVWTIIWPNCVFCLPKKVSYTVNNDCIGNFLESTRDLFICVSIRSSNFCSVFVTYHHTLLCFVSIPIIHLMDISGREGEHTTFLTLVHIIVTNKTHSPMGLVSRQWDAVDWACVRSFWRSWYLASLMYSFKYNQQDATLYNIFYCCRCSTCFRRVVRPSSGAQTVHTASSICQACLTYTRYCVYSLSSWWWAEKPPETCTASTAIKDTV